MTLNYSKQNRFFNRYITGNCELLIPFAISSIILYFRSSHLGVTTDGAVYLQIARNILLTGDLGWQASMFLPLHSILIAAVSYLFHLQDLLSATGIVAHSMYILLVLCVYSLSITIFDRRTAIVASTITAFFPHIIFIANSPEPEITYSFFILLSLFLYTNAVKKNSLIFAALTGIAFALAYLTRSEVLVVMVSVLFCTTAMQGARFYRSSIFKLTLIVLLVFTITVLPYLIKLNRDYGSFVLHPKATNVMLIVNWHVPYDNKNEVSYAELWRMNSEGRFAWQEPKGLGDLIKLIIKYPRESLKYYISSFARQIPGRIPNNSGMERFPQVFPIYLVIAMLFAFKKGTWGEYHRENKSILLSPFFILFSLPLLGGWWKYMVPYLPILIILASRGLANISIGFANKLNKYNNTNLDTIFLASATLVLVLRFLVALQPQPTIKMSKDTRLKISCYEEVEKAGVWAAKRFGSGKNYMLQWSRLIYYLNGLWTPDPLAETVDIIKFAKNSKVDLIVKEIFDRNLTLHDIEDTPEGIKFVDLYSSADGSYRVAFFKLQK